LAFHRKEINAKPRNDMAKSQNQSKEYSGFSIEYEKNMFKNHMPNLGKVLSILKIPNPSSNSYNHSYNLGICSYINGIKKWRMAFAVYSNWETTSSDSFYQVKYQIQRVYLFTDVNGYYFFHLFYNFSPFIGGGFGVGSTSLKINEDETGTLFWDVNVQGGIEFDIIKKWLYIRFEAGYLYSFANEPYDKTIFRINKKYVGPDLVEYNLKVPIELSSLKPQINGPFYGFTIGLNSPVEKTWSWY